MVQILNDNFVPSEYNSIFAMNSSIVQIRRLWQKITREYPAKGKYSSEGQFKYKSELLAVDFVTSYYQENSLLIEDFQRVDYFEKMSKLQLILEYNPTDLDATHIVFVEEKLKNLGLIS